MGVGHRAPLKAKFAAESVARSRVFACPGGLEGCLRFVGEMKYESRAKLHVHRGATKSVTAIRARSEIRWARARRSRGVSPIIAMILLVAVVVVLAAVLYVSLAGLTHGPSTASIGTAFSLGAPVAGQCWAAGVTAHVCGTTGDRLWNLTVEQSSVDLGDILFEVHSASGAIYKNPLNGAFSVILAGSTTPIAYYTASAGVGLAMGSGFTYAAGYSASTHVTSAMYIVVGTGTPAANWLPGEGNYVSVVGVDHYSGETARTVLP
jgi:flagellin-like protein